MQVVNWNEKEVVSLLREYGLSGYEARMYFTLLTIGEAKVENYLYYYRIFLDFNETIFTVSYQPKILQPGHFQLVLSGLAGCFLLSSVSFPLKSW